MGMLGDGGIEKKEKGLVDMDNSVVIAGTGEDVGGGGRGHKGNKW